MKTYKMCSSLLIISTRIQQLEAKPSNSIYISIIAQNNDAIKFGVSYNYDLNSCVLSNELATYFTPKYNELERKQNNFHLFTGTYTMSV